MIFIIKEQLHYFFNVPLQDTIFYYNCHSGYPYVIVFMQHILVHDWLGNVAKRPMHSYDCVTFTRMTIVMYLGQPRGGGHDVYDLTTVYKRIT